ncbi:universal stress protein [Ferviditalea candida]|uniref:Universal stress protein n=1 Tax=Ferviditalea candida TaxID=3108399 RepID=A0ABU5ZK11_9BACL|nr:universal stress protein [Paenibacillaceae bacterium T2]
MVFSKILVAYDGSPAADKALETAVELAKLNREIRIEALHVAKFPILIIGEGYISVTPDMQQKFQEEAEKIADRARAKLEAAGANHSVQMLEGEPASMIAEYARQNGFDLILIGSRGMSELKELFLGSVSHNVVQHSRIPVLVVK